MKVYINRQPINGPWGGGAKFVNSFHECIEEMGCSLIPNDSMTPSPDVILLAGLNNDGSGISADQAIMYKMMLSTSKDVKLVLRVNENDARKGTNTVDKYLLELSKHIDGTIFVSNWLRDYFLSKGWHQPQNTVIYNGVDDVVFKPNTKLINGKVNIVTEHWSDNPLKGEDVVTWLDEFVGKHSDEFTATFIGRTKASLKNTKLIKPLASKALGEELGKYDVCINATRFDPGPNSVIEPISCGIPTYVHLDGGGAAEFAGSDHVFENVDELEQLLLAKQFKPNVNRFKPWKPVMQEVVDYLKAVTAA